MSEERTGMDLLLSVINDLVTHNLYNLSHIGPEQIQCSTKKSKNSVIQDHAGVL